MAREVAFRSGSLFDIVILMKGYAGGLVHPAMDGPKHIGSLGCVMHPMMGLSASLFGGFVSFGTMHDKRMTLPGL
jgi:hypothetical protein